MSKVRMYLEGCALAWPSNFTPIERFLLDHGRDYRAQALPCPHRQGKAKHCFMNASHLALDHQDLSYVEGYAYRPDLIPLQHAWCVDLEGRVVDNTWDRPEVCEYLGVAFSRDHLSSLLVKHGYYGLLVGRRGPNLDVIECWKKFYCPPT